MLPHLRILSPHPGIYAYYDGRVPGYRFDPRDNWVDDGALSLGIASYALVQGDAAIVYDTGTTLAHGQAVRQHLDGLGVRAIRVILSHWHKDHVAGTAAFAGAEIIASARTAHHMRAARDRIEAGVKWPPICPLILPDSTYSGQMDLTLGPLSLRLIEVNIHSDDATVLWLPQGRILLAGDTVEDPLTYVAEPGDLTAHLAGLARLATLAPQFVLPCHGDPAAIAAGGYGAGSIAATVRYVQFLADLRQHPDRADTPVQDILGPDLDAGVLRWFAPYALVHAQNIAAVMAVYHGR